MHRDSFVGVTTPVVKVAAMVSVSLCDTDRGQAGTWCC